MLEASLIVSQGTYETAMRFKSVRLHLGLPNAVDKNNKVVPPLWVGAKSAKSQKDI